ncbi:MAG: tetratricopeptide repeat protein [Anaerolineae bacterium]|nr:tetratricopeptide repeat protein [Anaerolineae bacterium]
MLNNLKSFYAASNDFERAAHVIERLLVLHPKDYVEMRNLGLLYGKLGKKRQAAKLLEDYLAATPNAPDSQAIKNTSPHSEAMCRGGTDQRHQRMGTNKRMSARQPFVYSFYIR